MGASAGSVPPIWAAKGAALDEEAICFCFEVISLAKSLKKIEIESLRLWALNEAWRSLQTLDAELKEEEESNDDSWKDALRFL